MARWFDLNMEKVLDHWEPEHALREIIANALDEQKLTHSKDIEIYKADGKWHVRDFGRGLSYKHFTQNENQEKKEHPLVIGQFGVGLKDALAVLYRKEITVEIDSKFAHITLTMRHKAGFDDTNTLHAYFDEPKASDMVGTDFTFSGITDDAVEQAKSMFLCFNKNAVILERTPYGEVYSNGRSLNSIIFINGVQVATENNFLFSYNITNVNAQIKKALNRERTNVGRSAYSDSIKKILCQCKSEKILKMLIDDLRDYNSGKKHDESLWTDVAVYAVKTLNRENKSVFITQEKLNALSSQEREILEDSEKEVVIISERIASKVNDGVSTYEDIIKEYNDSFQYDFVEYDMLSPEEKFVFDKKDFVLHFLKYNDYRYKVPVKISETIQISDDGNSTEGVWDENLRAIVIKRTALSSVEKFLGVLAHEFAHYSSGYKDISRDFENVLTDMLGQALLACLLVIMQYPG